MNDGGNISSRKKEHLKLSLNENVEFRNKTTGFEFYDFKHYAITEVDITKIKFSVKFFKKRINYPFLISCMTGGATEAENINAQLAFAAEELNIPIGVGSQRAAIEEKKFENSFKIVRKNAPTVPVLSNIGIAEIVRYKSFDPIKKIINMVEADCLVIHVNPLQELLQPEGNANFKGLIKKIKKLNKEINIPVIIKEVGAGIGANAAEKLLKTGVAGIDVAGAGGTSWAGIELLRNKSNLYNAFWDWGLPTAYCIKEVAKLKKQYRFLLIGSGGINSAEDAAKAIALGADLVASARTILLELNKSGVDGVVNLLKNWFEIISNIMYLTGSQNLKQFKMKKIIKKESLY